MWNRRKLLASLAALPATAALGPAAAAPRAGIELASLRGSIDAAEFGVRPGGLDDQSRAFQAMLQKSSDTDVPVFLPAGVYIVSNLTLPARVRLAGVAGATRILYGGDGHLFVCDGAERVELAGLSIDGGNRWLGDQAQALVDLRNVARLSIDGCEIVGAGRHALALERAAGRIERCIISGAAEAGIWAIESRGLALAGNTVADCANGGILVHRWQTADDGTLVTGNRVERIAARNGGTGQFGNGINIFRANGVIVSGNAVADCAFSAVRANGASNIQIGGNTCLRSGETAIYAEFGFEGAAINGNIVDGAANGISIVNFNEGGRMAVCSANIVRNLSVEGPYPPDSPGFGSGITAEADASITGNVVEGAPLHGLRLGWGPFLRSIAATGNVVRSSATGVAVSVVEGAGAAVISDNMFEATPNGAVVGYEWAKPVTGDLAREGTAHYRNVTVERNRVG